MAKRNTTYVCQQCGAHSPAYLGRCPNCNSWNSMVETIEPRTQSSGKSGARSPMIPSIQAQRISEVEAAESQRIKTSIAELDRVLGGGLVPGSRRAGRRRSRHRQIDTRPASGRATRRRHCSESLRQRRGIDSSDSACGPNGLASPAITFWSFPNRIWPKSLPWPSRPIRAC